MLPRKHFVIIFQDELVVNDKVLKHVTELIEGIFKDR
jgi:hypothetical protein